MAFPFKPGKLTCVGLVAIMMVLPSTLWKAASARATVRVTASPKRQHPAR
jgi:hypothetical protein